MAAPKKKNPLEKIWEGPPSPTPKTKAEVEQLQKKIKEKLQADPELIKKAVLIITEWLDKPKK